MVTKCSTISLAVSVSLVESDQTWKVSTVKVRKVVHVKWAASRLIQQSGMCTQRRLRSAWASPVWSESSLPAWQKLESLATHWAHSEDYNQTGQMPRLIWVFAGRTVILLVLSWGGSNIVLIILVLIKKYGFAGHGMANSVNPDWPYNREHYDVAPFDWGKWKSSRHV